MSIFLENYLLFDRLKSQNAESALRFVNLIAEVGLRFDLVQK